VRYLRRPGFVITLGRTALEADMDGEDRLAERFTEHREHLRAVAYRMLGSLEEADDAVQETWLRLSRADTASVANLRGWLTTVTGRICLDMLRSRASRREQLVDFHIPDPVVTPLDHTMPEQEALIAESVGLALHVVLETLPPAQRLTFVLHDIFAVPIDEIAAILGRSPAATKQLAARARARIRTDGPPGDADPIRQHQAVKAFYEAARNGDFDALVALLASDVVLRSDGGGVPARATRIRGAAAVAHQVQTFMRPGATVHPALVNGAAGVVISARNRVVAVIGFTVRDAAIAAIDGIADPARLARIDFSGFAIAPR
jgi:RNA polymerase sigma factor (sigma-70 family)